MLTIIKVTGFINKKPLKLLGENLQAIGKVRNPNSAAHHIVAGGSNNAFANDAREILLREGIDINEAANGVFLPKSSKYVIDDAVAYSKVRTNIYYKTILDILEKAPALQSFQETEKYY